MRFTRIYAEDFRQHRRLELDLSDDTDVTIVAGNNGTGKTNFMNALVWCLYGDEEYPSKGIDSAPMVNLATLDDAQLNDIVTAVVELYLTLADGTEAHVKRTQDFVKTEGSARKRGEDELTVMVMEDIGKGYESIENPKGWVERFVPSRVKPYFLFDGERLDSFFRHAEARRVEDAVLQIAQIDLLGNLVKHLEKVSSELYSKTAGGSAGEEIRALGEKLEQTRARLAKVEEEIADRNNRVQKCEETIRQIESQMGNVAELAADLAKKKDLEGQLVEATVGVDEAWAAMYEWAANAAPSLLAVDALVGLRDKIDQARDKRELPPPVSVELLRRLLAEQQCICGTGLAEESTNRARIQQLLSDYEEIGQVGEQLLQLEPDLRTCLGRLQAAPRMSDELMKRIDDWESRHKAINDDLKHLSSKVVGHDDQQISQLQAQLSKANEDVREEERALAKLAIAKEAYSEKERDVEGELERKAAKEGALKTVLTEARFSRECLGVAERIFGELTNEVRETVARALEAHFLDMIWKKESFREVSIDDRYNVSVLNKRGYEVLPDLSAGERECLALAFSLALSEVSGYELPIVIDTPLGRLDPDVQTYVTEVLSRCMKDHQLIMLMTGTEYNSEVARAFEDSRPDVLELEFDEADQVARLERVG